MAQYRQSGADRFAFRNHHEPHGPSGNRIPYKSARIRRPAKPHRRRLPAAVVVVVTFTGVLFVTFLAFRGLSSDRGIAELGSRSNGTSGYAKELRFGHGSAGRVGRDSRYWDRDDRRRDRDYSEEDLPKEESGGKKDRILESRKGGNRKNLAGNGGGLYNEAGRKELDSYKEEYEASLKNGEQFNDDGLKDDDPADEYDDGIDVDDEYDVARKLGDDNEGGSEKGGLLDRRKKVSGELGGSVSGKKEEGRVHGNVAKLSGSEKKSGSKRKPKHHKFSSSTCEMKFLNSTAQLVEPVVNKKFASFSLRYTEVEESPSGSEDWEPRFAGHQTLQEREKTYYAHDQTINCGFIKGPDGSPSTGFDITEDDMKYMSSCHIVLSSCIFGNSDRLRTPFGKTITRLSRKNVCFVMFLDQSTLETLSSEGQKKDSAGFIGLWKIIVIKNLPYNDMRRVGKIPKFLPHRLFPSARYSIWVDSKLRLQTDPILILEYFLWRHGHEYAISNHYARSCVSEEVLQNKRLNKYNHTVIDQQYEFYQADGLRKFDPSDPNKLLPSYVPEGSFIVRAHTPMSNLFSCLWFNEVDRFTPRDQLSFAYTYLKLRRMNPGKPFRLNMFKDCERRSIAKLFHHRAEEKRSNPTQLMR